LGTADTTLDADQTLSDADQTGADLDQTSSDTDQGASDRDQRASDRDQRAADLDQAASDQAQLGGSGLANYARTRSTRSQTARDRDTDSQTRADSAGVREVTAQRRDRDASARDEAARARDTLAVQLDAEIERLEAAERENGDGAGAGVDLLLRASRHRKRAAAARSRAATYRLEAADDRARAREDRTQAAVDRRIAAEELVAEGIDGLTGALRRRVGNVAIQREIDRTDRTHEPLVVGFVDVDGLKAVNDTRGHAAGDDLLAGVASSIQLALRPYDVIARFGGDEFVCTLAGHDLEGVRIRFGEISAHIAETQNGATITVGLAERHPHESLDEVVVRADVAMSAARSNGR
jgi:diguanylate cyclase (GGDEF)-like protein